MLNALLWRPHLRELRGLPETARRQLLGEADARTGRRFGQILIAAIPLALSLGLPYFVPYLTVGLSQDIRDWLELLALAAILFVLLLFIAQIRRLQTRELEQVMLERGVRPSVCFGCGYDLKGIDRETCPECGRKIAPPADDTPDR